MEQQNTNNGLKIAETDQEDIKGSSELKPGGARDWN
jgi:hypothetical protein